MSDAKPPPQAARATVRRSRRFPIIWVIPLLAVAIGGWLAWDTLSKRGPTITVTFETAEGLQAGQSQLKFKDITLGTVQSLNLTDDHKRVAVVIETTRQAEPLLTEGTIFWVVTPRLFAGNIEGLSTLASGPFIGMLPASPPGKPQKDFRGNEDPPVLPADTPGHTFLLKASRLGSLSVGSPIFFRDLDVGVVLGWDIGQMAEDVTIHAFVRAPFDTYVKDESRFWNASGFSVKLTSTGIQFQIESIRAVLLGGIAFDTPPKDDVPMSSNSHVFPLFANADAAKDASYTRSLRIVSYFPGSVAGLGPGSDVTLHGLTIGKVLSVGIAYDREKDSIVAPVHFEVFPQRIGGMEVQLFKTQEEAVAVLLRKGLRAQLYSTNLLTGQQAVGLQFEADAPMVPVTKEGDSFLLPTTDSGDIAGLQASAATLLNKINSIPFDAIGRNLNGILQSANNLASSAEVRKSASDIASIIKRVNDIVAQVNSDLGPSLKQLPEVTAGLNKTLANANRLVESIDKGYGDNTKFNRDLERLLVQATDAMNSIRSLADLLARDPTALIRGRPTGETK